MRTIEELVDIPAAGFPRWSPDGSSLAYLFDQPGTGWQLLTYEVATAERRMLDDRPVRPGRPAWSPDGMSIAVVRGNSDGGSDIWLVPVSGEGAARRLAGGAWETRSPAFSPDGGSVAFISGEAGTLDVWLVPTAGGEAKRLTEATNPLDEPRWTPQWSPDGAWIAYVSSRSGERNNDDLWFVSPDGNDHRQLTTGLMVNTDAVWSPDGAAVALVGNTTNEHWYGDDADVWRVDAREGPSTRLTPAGGHSWRLDGGGLAWSPDGGTIYALSHRNGDKNITAVPADGGVRTAVTNVTGTITDFALSPDGGTLAYIHASQIGPPDLFIMPAAGGRATRITDCDRAVDRASLQQPERVPYRSYDGLYCDAYLYLPPDFDEHARYPGLIQVHGGGTNSYGNGWHPVEQWLAAQGFVVLAVEYRGSSGYGRDFAGLSYADWGGGQTRDAVAAGEWLRAQPYIGKVGLYGQSYGGYLTLHGIVAAPDLFSAAVDMYGKTNMFTAQVHADRVGRVFVARDYWGRLAHEIPEAMERASTYQRLSRIKTPLLILHGDRDPRVPPMESAQVAETMQQAGLPHDYVVYPGEGHGFRRREHRIDCYQRILAWLTRYLSEDA
jgi:dipeptidyl aminopeptidase/acylaminoacyl peptidase